jgi:hypothetical protein
MFATTLHRQENPDRKVSTEREHAEWTAKFLAVIDNAAGPTCSMPVEGGTRDASKLLNWRQAGLKTQKPRSVQLLLTDRAE